MTFMAHEDKIKLAIELIKFFLYIVTLIISIASHLTPWTKEFQSLNPK